MNGLVIAPQDGPRISRVVQRVEREGLRADRPRDWFISPGTPTAEVRIPDDSESGTTDSESEYGCHTYTSAIIERWNSTTECFEDTDDLLWVFDRGGATLTPGGKYTVKLMESGFRGRTLAYVISASGGSSGSDGIEVVVFPVDEDCSIDPFDNPVTVSPTYSAVHIISHPSIGGALTAHDDGRTWHPSTGDRVFEENGFIVNPGRRVRLFYGGVVNHDNMDGTFTTFRQWFFKGRPDPTCWVKRIVDIGSGDGDCTQCYVYDAVYGPFLSTSVEGAGCIIDFRTCQDDSES